MTISQLPKTWCRLGLAVLLIAGIWVGLLPRLGTIPAIHRRTQLLDENKIDAASLFYTDLECMEEVEKQMAATRAQHPSAFWLRGDGRSDVFP